MKTSHASLQFFGSVVLLAAAAITRHAAAGTQTTFSQDYSYWDIAAYWSPAYPNSTSYDPVLSAGRTALIRNAVPAVGIVYIGTSTTNPRRAFVEVLPGASLDALQLLLGFNNGTTGILYHCGGNVIARDACRIGENSDSSGSRGIYYLSAGTLSKPSGEPLYVGYNGRGLLQITANAACHAVGIVIGNAIAANGSKLDQRGGSVIISGDLDIGSSTSANGTYHLSGGSLVWSNACTVRDTLIIEGGAADAFSPATGTPLSFASTATLRYLLDAKGASPIRVPNGTVSVNASTKLIIDGAYYTRSGGRPASYLLLQYNLSLIHI